MIRNPYYEILRMMGSNGGLQLAIATLKNAEKELFQVEGKRAAIAGRAKGLTIEDMDEGGTFLCLGTGYGWFVLCKLEEM